MTDDLVQRLQARKVKSEDSDALRAEAAWDRALTREETTLSAQAVANSAGADPDGADPDTDRQGDRPMTIQLTVILTDELADRLRAHTTLISRRYVPEIRDTIDAVVLALKAHDTRPLDLPPLMNEETDR